MTTPDDLRTRTAKVLHRLYGPSLGAHPWGWDQEPSSTRDSYLTDADAVIYELLSDLRTRITAVIEAQHITEYQGGVHPEDVLRLADAVIHELDTNQNC